MRQIVLDTETTGLATRDGHRIIEIGCVELCHRKITGKTFHTYLNPKRSIDEGAMRVHGITNEFVADKPCFRDIVAEFKKFIQGAELIIHNAPFDIGFLEYELSLLEDRWVAIRDHCKVIDTLVMARDKHPGQRNNLDALCKRYEINNQHREFHGALLDASILAEVYLAMTGGQGTLFSLDSEQNGQQQFGHQRLASTVKGLRIVEATEEERLAHDNFVAKLLR
jgi:DNA polymerase-3 subunit epsilon